jgi:transcriptional regulator with XRE-family HTH domain
MDEATRFGERLFGFRERKGLSQEQIARLLDVDKSYISRLESGHANPTLATIVKLAQVLSVEPAELLR